MCLSLSAGDPFFASFLAALDAASPLPGVQLPFNPNHSYIPLEPVAPHTDPPYILGQEQHGVRLFTRSCYPSLCDLMMKLRGEFLDGDVEKKNLILTGNSGVGKTLFAAYLIKYLRSLSSPPNIVYEVLGDAVRYRLIPPPGGQAFTESGDAPAAASLKSTVHIVDASKNAETVASSHAFTIIIASPHAVGQLRKHKKQAIIRQTLYMPVWSKEELECCRRVVCPTVAERTDDQLLGNSLPARSATEIALGFERFGGIARTVLRQTHSKQRVPDDFEKALTECNIETLAKVLTSNLDMTPETSSWLLHYVVDETTFTLKRTVWATAYVEKVMWDLVGDSQQNWIKQYISKAFGLNPLVQLEVCFSNSSHIGR